MKVKCLYVRLISSKLKINLFCNFSKLKFSPARIMFNPVSRHNYWTPTHKLSLAHKFSLAPVNYKIKITQTFCRRPSFYISKKIQKMALLHILKFVTQNISFLLMDILFTKNDFWHYFYAKFHTFFVKYIFEKKSILSYKSGFIPIHYFRVMLSINWMMKHIH